MKLEDAYKDWRIIAGLALMMVGVGNWTIGLHRTELYARIIARAPDKTVADEAYRSFDEIDLAGNGAVLNPLTNEERKLSYAAARMDFYHALFMTGQVFFLAGLVLTLLGFVVVIQRDARRAIGHANARLGGGQGEPGPRRW